MYKRYKLGFGVVAILAVLSLAITYTRRVHVAILDPAGPVAHQERNLLFFGLALSVVVVIPVFILAAVIAWRYREDNPKKVAYMPEWDHSALAESVWWGVPTLLIAILSVVAWNSSHTLDPSRSLAGNVPPITVQVVALDWKWLFIYPQQHIASVNTLVFPVNTPISFQITADAPMNSFWIPRLGGQIYAMPGMVTQLHLLASSEGSYRGSSANISGRGFAGMNFMAQAVSSNDFDEWARTARQSPSRLSLNAYQGLSKPSINNHPAVYALETQGLYNDVLMKYMSPDMQMTGMNMPATEASAL